MAGKFLKIVASLLVVFSLNSCDTEPLDEGLLHPEIPVGQTLFKVNINGISYSTSNAVATVSNGYLTIVARTADGQFVLQSEGALVGTYTNEKLDFEYTNLISGDSYPNINVAQEGATPNGELTVTSINNENKTISGNFKFTGYRVAVDFNDDGDGDLDQDDVNIQLETVNFTAGQFINIPYTFPNP